MRASGSMGMFTSRIHRPILDSGPFPVAVAPIRSDSSTGFTIHIVSDDMTLVTVVSLRADFHQLLVSALEHPGTKHHPVVWGEIA